jgi:hypothetical protein
MIARPATSTPRPLPRKREPAGKHLQPSIAGAIADRAANNNGSRIAPATTIQTNEAPLTRRKTIQKEERESDSRLAKLARIDALRTEIRALVEQIALDADIELLDLMRDEVGSFMRHKAAQEARTWAGAAGVQLETGLMMLDRAMRPTLT